MRLKHNLHQNWILKPGSRSKLPETINFPDNGISAVVPGTVHTDLLKHKLIDNPFYADTERHLTWVENQKWCYETIFDIPDNFNPDQTVYLVFEGIDTIADILINGKKIYTVENMFRRYEFDISGRLKQKNNRLRIEISPPRKAAREKSRTLRQFPSARHPERVFIRKAQYAFGWDWGPAFPTSGIWRPVYLLQRTESEIESIRFDTLSLKKNIARVQVTVKAHAGQRGTVIRVNLKNGRQVFMAESGLNGQKPVIIKWKIPDPQLWWPNGMGNPSLSDLKVDLLNKQGEVIDCRGSKVGIRKIELVLEERKKPTFRFRVNDCPVFVKGANWIPADSFLTRVDSEKYAFLLGLAREAHMNMIRVWGGGIYENDQFYDLCDKLGLMVWQDFMFACAAYPQDAGFLGEIKEEVRQQVQRLQMHPSLAIWCGNNENEWIWYRDHCGKINKMPGFKIFHDLIPDLVRQSDPLRPYWPSTPFGSEDDPNDSRSGNRHVWDIWSRWLDYNEVIYDHSHFVTEFGFQGPADYYTLAGAIPEPAMHPHSVLMEFHNKQEEGPERLTRFLAGHLPLRTEIRAYIYLTQLNQGFALKRCLDHWRANSPETNGTIIWQLNDCWPVSSWSLIDSDNRKKQAYFFVKRSFSPVSMFFYASDRGQNIILSNQGPQHFEGFIEIIRFSSTEGIETDRVQFPVNLPVSARSHETDLPADTDLSDKRFIFIARLIDKKGIEIARDCYYSEKWKHLNIRDVEITKKLRGDRKNPLLCVTSNRLALFVTLMHPELDFSENSFLLLPGEKFSIKIKSKEPVKEKINEIEIFTLNQFLSA